MTAVPVHHILRNTPAGAHPRETWLYIHSLTPTVLWLAPPVVAFLLEGIDALSGEPAQVGPVCWELPAGHNYAYARCVVAGRTRAEAALYVHSCTPTILALTPAVTAFLRETLAELPAEATDASVTKGL